MYCRRNKIIAFIDSHCSVGIVYLDLDKVTVNDVEMVESEIDLEGVVSQAEDKQVSVQKLPMS